MERPRAVITGVGAYYPDYVLTNEELSRMVDTTDEWIMTRIGIKERRILRDADKIDILRVNVETPMEEIYNVSTEALRQSPVTPAVLDAFYEHHCILHSLKKWPADNAVSHASLVFELCYPESLRIVDEQGWLWRLLDFKTENADTAKTFAAITAEMKRWIGERM